MNNQLFSKIAVWLVIGLVLFTVFKQFDTRGAAGANVVGYSDFLDEVRNKHIKTAIIQEGQGGTAGGVQLAAGAGRSGSGPVAGGLDLPGPWFDW